MFHDTACHVLADFINLVIACEEAGATLPENTLEEARASVDAGLRDLGIDDADLPLVWSGEIQLTSS